MYTSWYIDISIVILPSITSETALAVLLIWVWLATDRQALLREEIIKWVNTHKHTDAHTHTITHARIQSCSRVELSLLTALSIFPLIRSSGQRTSLKGHCCTANCLIKKFGGARGQLAGPRRGPRLTELGVPEAVASRDQLSSETLTSAADPVYLHPIQTDERRDTVLSLCLHLPFHLHLSLCLSLYPLCCESPGWLKGEWDRTEWRTDNDVWAKKKEEIKRGNASDCFYFLSSVNFQRIINRKNCLLDVFT